MEGTSALLLHVSCIPRVYGMSVVHLGGLVWRKDSAHGDSWLMAWLHWDNTVNKHEMQAVISGAGLSSVILCSSWGGSHIVGCAWVQSGDPGVQFVDLWTGRAPEA